MSITLYKGGAPEGDMHGANAISGGTITSEKHPAPKVDAKLWNLQTP